MYSKLDNNVNSSVSKSFLRQRALCMVPEINGNVSNSISQEHDGTNHRWTRFVQWLSRGLLDLRKTFIFTFTSSPSRRSRVLPGMQESSACLARRSASKYVWSLVLYSQEETLKHPKDLNITELDVPFLQKLSKLTLELIKHDSVTVFKNMCFL